jgi:hypothetical protein
MNILFLVNQMERAFKNIKFEYKSRSTLSFLKINHLKNINRYTV